MLWPWHRGAFLKQDAKTQALTKKKIQIFNYIKMKNFCTTKDVIRKKSEDKPQKGRRYLHYV